MAEAAGISAVAAPSTNLLPQAAPPSAPIPVMTAMAAVPGGALPQASQSPAMVRDPKPVSLRELEMQAIVESLERNHGNKPRTAEELGISLKTLYNKLHQLADAHQAAGQASPAVGWPTDAAA